MQMNTEIQYTERFFDDLKAMVDQRPHFCRGCGVVDGELGYRKDGARKKFKSIVRLCLRDPKGPPNDAKNVAMYCMRCRKPGQEWRAPKRLKPSELPQLNFKDEPVELRCDEPVAETFEGSLVERLAA